MRSKENTKSGKKQVKYSYLKEKLNLKPQNDIDNTQANLTHYLQNIESEAGGCFLNNGTAKYLSDLENIAVTDDAAAYPALKLPIEWDIPFPPPRNPQFTFIDLFAGIGGIRLAYQRQGGKCVFTSEWDNFAKITYEMNFGEVPFGDITKIKEDTIPNHDLLLAGFPCQPFSIAGVSKKNSLGRDHGFLDKTQGTLFFDVARILQTKRPRAFMLENVKNLLSHDKKRTFSIIQDTLKNLDYNVHYKVLDGKHFVPQHRERIIIVGFDNRVFNGNENFKWPEIPEVTTRIADILCEIPDEKYTLSDKLWTYLQDYAIKHKAKGNGFGYGLTNINSISRTLSARYYKDGSEILIPQNNKNPRRLTPRECARLMGYPDEFIIKVSDNQAYKQFGNSVIVPLMESVAKELAKIISK